MKYVYDQEAISFVNRVYNVASAPISSENIYTTPGVSTLAAAMWFEADKLMDGGDNDIIFEEYVFIDKLYEIVVQKPYHPTIDPIWNLWDEVADMAAGLETKIWLASCVVNAMIALEGRVDIIWQDEKATIDVEKEFIKERDLMRFKIRRVTADWNAHHHNEQVRDLLQKNDDKLLRERAEARLALSQSSPVPQVNATARRVIGLDYDLNDIYAGSTVRHIADGWEGVVIKKGNGDAVWIDRHDGEPISVIVDELAVITS
jgi:hypothetical protein